MDYRILKRLLNSFSKKKPNLNLRLVVFLFFFTVALILWYLNKLTYEYSTEITFPLRIENLPKGKVLIGELPKNITLQIRAHGYTLLQYKLGAALRPIFISLDQLPPVPLNNSDTKFFLLTARGRNAIANQLKGGLQLGRVTPDSLFFEFTTMAQKRVRVAPVISLSFERQHIQAGALFIKPDSITISGPQALLDTIFTVLSQPVKLDRLSSTANIIVGLKEVSQVSYSHRKVNLNIPVGRFTEANFSQSIEVRNIPDSLSLILLPRTVSIKCNVLIDSFKDLTDGKLLDPYVDYLNINPVVGNRLRVNISSIPFVVKVLDSEPAYVDFIIERI